MTADFISDSAPEPNANGATETRHFVANRIFTLEGLTYSGGTLCPKSYHLGTSMHLGFRVKGLGESQARYAAELKLRGLLV